ncbi:MAG: acyl-CoA dehydrogenase, partial [Gemmatimonadetes bacterium]|nr:acyl-CoA dehydrogenase [Gemmatimonadota bacterium]
WVARALAGEAVGAFAMTEWEAGSDVASMATAAVPEGDGAGHYVLDGGKAFISNAGIADFYVVFASTDPGGGTRGISCFVVPADAPGLEFLGAQVMSAPHPLGEIRFLGCRVPAGTLLGEAGTGFRTGMSALDRLRPTVAAAACGMAGRALWEAVQHARRRHQFGKPLGSFQLIQEKLAESATELTAGRLLTYRAAWEKDRGAARITVEAAMAKAFSTEAAQRIVDRSVQVLGGRGVLASHPVEHLYRSVRALRIYEGTTEIQHLIIGGALVRGSSP